MLDSAAPILIAPTPRGLRLAQELRAGLPGASLWTKADAIADPEAPPEDTQCYAGKLGDLAATLWSERRPLVFVLAVGAVVRTIAPLLKNKISDPPVVAVNDAGTHAIAVAGGHQAGADRLARQVAALLNAEAIVTSASEGQGLPATDLLGVPFGWRPGPSDWLGVARSLTQWQTVGAVQTCGWDLWREELPDWHSLVVLSPQDLTGGPVRAMPPSQGGCLDVNGVSVSAILWIGDRHPPPLPVPVAAWHPRVLWVGIGCERGASADLLESAVRQAFAGQDLALEAIAGLASLDLKRDEAGLLELARRLDVPLRFFGADDLAAIAAPNPSPTVAAAVGTPSVAEAAARRAADGGEWVAEKQVARDASGACTVAIARATVEYTPRQGKLCLVGIGPGRLDQLVPAARAALADCDAVIGYQLYLDLIRPLLHPRQIVEGTPITRERDRALRAIQLARRGLTVAVVSSGDCGIYGMAGLVLECLAADGWDGDTPAVETFPGITALQAAAARAGAPLMHDFCAISLSDLLTPWPVIRKRLEAAASADFVVALYNPRSQKRQTQLAEAFDILRQHRAPETPVVFARSLYRPEERVEVTDLERADPTSADMLAVVLVGNASSFACHGRVVTPRGYRV